MSIDRTKNKTFILDKDDVNNANHLYLWYDILEIFDVNQDATEICIELSSLDENRKVAPNRRYSNE